MLKTTNFKAAAVKITAAALLSAAIITQPLIAAASPGAVTEPEGQTVPAVSVPAASGGFARDLSGLVPGGGSYGYQWLSNPANVGQNNVAKLTHIYKGLETAMEMACADTGTYGGYGEQIDLNGLGLTVDSYSLIQLAESCFKNDNPQYYMYNGGGTYWYTQAGKTLTSYAPLLNPAYAAYETRQTIAARIEAEYREYEALAATVSAPYDKIRLVHDKIAAEVDYNYMQDNGVFVPSTDLVSGSILSVLDHRANGPVCSGYANSFAYILNRLGVGNVITVAGDTAGDAGEGTGRHAWNLVELDGLYYYVDVTWDDNDHNNPNIYGFDAGNLSNSFDYEYFLVGSGNSGYAASGRVADEPFVLNGHPDGGYQYSLPANISQHDYIPPSNYSYLTYESDYGYRIVFSDILLGETVDSKAGNPVYVPNAEGSYNLNDGPFTFADASGITLYKWPYNNDGYYVTDKFPGEPVKLMEGIDYVLIPEQAEGFTRVWIQGIGEWRGITFVCVQ